MTANPSPTRPRRSADGGIYPHPSAASPKRWRIQWTDRDGERRQRYVGDGTPATWADADAVRADVIAERSAGRKTPRRRHTLATWLPLWLEAKPGIREQSRKQYRSQVRHWERDPISRIVLADLLPEHVQLAMRRMAGAGRGPATIAMGLAALRMALDAAENSGHVTGNVARRVDAPRFERRAIQIPDGDELARIHVAIAADPWESLWLLGLVGGLRQGEALALHWGDVNMGAGVITVTGSLIQNTDTIGDPKSSSGWRPVVVYPEVIDALARHRDRAYGPGVTPHPSELVFQRAPGLPLRSNKVLRRWWALCERAAVRRYRFHDLRHAAITDLAELGMPLHVLKAWAGHSKLSITERYLHVRQTQIVLPERSVTGGLRNANRNATGWNGTGRLSTKRD